ncbi:GNAT family N-acetyltransferase [Romeria aff. gracilis LEGE 07310]|uniref:GNAT family N-acetyltransferase n=1 Tax=Vasconcelosia minhoensis LEGE 07310 TaxID=915328 RepID=A0A8J7A8V4_9CYAN|nr:GNAT family N-acetyltransferase [Romeria gracilis]MBE9076151.1 GNAT family N-acetyltransferase [Romeria aff. gracilis LEGE 07310]
MRDRPSPPSFDIPGYRLESGSPLDRARLVKFMQRAYRELGAVDSLSHLADTVERHLSSQSQIWWLMADENGFPVGLPGVARPEPIGCLWLGEAIDQRSGQKQAYIFLVYISVDYRRRGLARAMMDCAHRWARHQGYDQIGLQVFTANQPAMQLYEKLGYSPQAIWMMQDL